MGLIKRYLFSRSQSNYFKKDSKKISNIDLDKIKNLGDLDCPYCKAKSVVKCGCGAFGRDGGIIVGALSSL